MVAVEALVRCDEKALQNGETHRAFECFGVLLSVKPQEIRGIGRNPRTGQGQSPSPHAGKTHQIQPGKDLQNVKRFLPFTVRWSFAISYLCEAVLRFCDRPLLVFMVIRVF